MSRKRRFCLKGSGSIQASTEPAPQRLGWYPGSDLKITKGELALSAVSALGIYADHSTADDPVYFKKIFPNGKTVEVPGTGHFVMMEKLAEFNRLLADFLPQASF